MKIIMSILMLMALFASLAACNSTGGGELQEATNSTASSTLASDANDQAEYDDKQLLLSDSEVIDLVKRTCSEGRVVFAWYFVQGAYLELAEPAPGPRPVLSPFRTISEMKAATELVFTKRFCEAVLYPFGFEGDHPVFVEIEGELCWNLVDGIIYNENLTDDITIVEKSHSRITVEIVSSHFDPDLSDRRPIPFEFTLVYEDDIWKLDNWYNFVTEYRTHIG